MVKITLENMDFFTVMHGFTESESTEMKLYYVYNHGITKDEYEELEDSGLMMTNTFTGQAIKDFEEFKLLMSLNDN